MRLKEPATLLQRLLSPQYRFEVSKELAHSTKCTDVLLFDHMIPSDPHGESLYNSFWYERCIISALPLTASFRVHVLMQAPPLPAEMAFVSDQYQLIADHKQLHIWLQDPKDASAFIDIFELYTTNQTAYIELVRNTFHNASQGSHTFHIDALPRLLKIKNLGKTLVLPYQTTDWHYDIYKELLAQDKIVLPDSADRWENKGKAHKYFENHGTADIRPVSIYIPMDDLRSNNEAHLRKVAERVEAKCRKMIRDGKIPFVKLAANGLAGFGIITPEENPLLDKDLKPAEQTSKFYNMVNEILNGVPIIPDALVEENLTIASDSEGKKEYILSGILINKKFHVWSICRAIITKNGVYEGVIVSQDVADIGLTEEGLKKAIAGGERLVKAMAEGAYHTGYIAKDFVVIKDSHGVEKYIYHDDNDRRGGRTIADHTAALTSQGYCDRNYRIDVPTKDYPEYIIKVTDKLREKGLQVYGTGTVYTNSKTITLRVLTPLAIVKDENAIHGGNIPLSEAVKTFVLSAIESTH